MKRFRQPASSPYLTRNTLLVSLLLLGVALPSATTAGPQHWGFGFSYLAAIEEVDGTRRLVVYEPPLFARDHTWLSRWVDRETDFGTVDAGGLAVGDYWPDEFGTAYLTTVRQDADRIYIDTYQPPEFFTTDAWAHSATSGGLLVSGSFLGATAGDLRGVGNDQLVVALQDGSDIRVALYNPLYSPGAGAWGQYASATLPDVMGDYLGIACGNFWTDGGTHLVLATDVGGTTQLRFYDWTGSAFNLVTTDAAPLPTIIPNGLTAADYEKDGFALLTLVRADGTFELRSAPARPGDSYDPGPEYTGQSLARVPMPGNGGTASQLAMTGTFGATADQRIAVGAGRLFGYIETNLDQRWPIAGGYDPQISFIHRTPRKDQVPPYGWPANGDPVTFEVNLSNNSSALAIPANAVRLKIWYNRLNRNADTDPLTCDTPDVNILIDESLPAYDPYNPSYVMRSVSFDWPYNLVWAGDGATWKRLDLNEGNERWVIARIEFANDLSRRNNRYEVPVHGVTFHPCLRTNDSLADRNPTVYRDPPSKEYLCRKIADAVQCMWERSPTRDGDPVLQRLYFDSYQIGWPNDAPNPQEAWEEVQSKYEGWRELDGWWGINQGWERFDWWDGGAELHETGHLFHPIGDLYQYHVSPVWSGTATMHDGTPVKLRTWVWAPDSYGTGHTRITWPACEIMDRHIVGVRNNYMPNWLNLVSDRTFIRVLDRYGQPVYGAEVKIWEFGHDEPWGTGYTDSSGRWETTNLWGSYWVDDFGRKHYDNGGRMHLVTVRIGSSYQDFSIPGIESRAPFSHHSYMGHSFTDPDEWTWDFETNFAFETPGPDFELIAAVKGSTAQIGIQGEAGATYKLYRRWEPAYIRTLVGEFTATDDLLTITQDMAAADSHSSGRFRATYEVTEDLGWTESLPQRVQVTGLGTTRGLAARDDGVLVVSANNGIANPWCQLFQGTTPYQELLYHFRFGHTANRVVASHLVDGKYYATLSFSDMNPDYRFDLVLPPTGENKAYDVRNEISGTLMINYSDTEPYWIQCQNLEDARKFAPGDLLRGHFGTANVIDADGVRLYVDQQVVATGYPWFSGTRLAGVPGSNAELRQLQDARGVEALVAGNGKEYVVIADTGNRRVVVWDDMTRYVTHWQFADSSEKPAAVAADPTTPGRFFLLNRRFSGGSKLYLFGLDTTAGALWLEEGYPKIVPVGNDSFVNEMGLAAAADPAGGNTRLLVTDANSHRVLELQQSGDGTWPTVAAYTAPIGVFAGEAALYRPVDVTFVQEGQTLRRYATDARDRVLLLAETTATYAASDLDEDWDVDFADFDIFDDCLTGPGGGVPGGCDKADFDQDDDVDLPNFAEFQRAFTGP